MNRLLKLSRRLHTPLFTALVMMSATLLPVHAGAKVKRNKAALFQCKAELTTPDGSALQLTAWGPNEGVALEQLLRTGLLTAEIQAMPEAWIGLFFEGAPERTSFAEQLESVPTEPAGVAPGFPVPGFSLSEGVCAAQELPPTRATHKGWEATWLGGGKQTMSSPDPAIALEATRRRSCMTTYQDTLATMWQELATAPPDQVRTRYVDGWKGARDAAVACLTADGPAIEPVSEVETLPAIAGEWAECTAREPFPNEHAVTARGWSDGLPWAIESALQTLPYAISRSTFGLTAEIVTDAAPEQRAQLVAAQAQRLTRMLAPDAAQELLQLQCSDIPADDTAALMWLPQDVRLAPICEPEGGWSVARQPLAGATPGEALWALQMHLVYPYLGVSRLAWEASDKDPSLAISGRGIVALCEASSLGDALLVTDRPTAIRLPGTPDRSTQQAASAVLDRALTGQNIGLLFGCVRPELREAMADGYAREGAEGFWSTMSELFPEAIGSGELVWAESGGVWMLAEP